MTSHDESRDPKAGSNPGERAPGDPGRQPTPGLIRHQVPGESQARPMTLGEARAYQRAEEHAQTERDRKRRRKRRLLIGGAGVAGVAALVGGLYAASTPKEVTARCVDQNQVVVDESNCDRDSVAARGGHTSGGFFILPGGRQYRYNYGGSGGRGTVISGGTYERPRGANVNTPSGKSVQRGGFGIRGSSGG